MSGEYVPSWKREVPPAGPDRIPDDEKYGSGTYPDTGRVETSEKSESSEDPHATIEKLNTPATFDDLRHPSVFLGTPPGEGHYFETIENPSIKLHGCDNDHSSYVINGHVDSFPPGEDLEISVFGIWEGDTATGISVEIIDANPIKLLVREDNATLYRWWANGCPLCGGDRP